MLVLVDLAGVLPRPVDAAMQQRVQLCETLAAQTAAAATTDDLRSIRSALRVAVERNPEVLSAGLRASGGRMLVAQGQHARSWDPDPETRERATHVEVPLMRSGRDWATLEVRFKDAPDRGLLETAWNQPLLRMMLLMGAMGFFAYLAYMKRTLRHLDPSSVIPTRVQAALDVMAGGVLLVDQNERIVLANAVFAERFSKSASALLGKKASSLPWGRPDSPETNPRLPWVEAMESIESVTATLSLEDKFGERRSLIVRGSPVLDGWDRAKGAIATFDDVTELERKTAELEEALEMLEKSQEEITQQNTELEFLAHHDPLTGASNRRFFMQRFGGDFETAGSGNRQVCCVMVDIDHFKKVNDNHGHQMGDEVIRRVSEALVTEVRSKDNVCRYGGEEFCLVLQDTDVIGAANAAERMRARIAAPGFTRVPVTASFGVSSIQFGARDLSELIEQADRSLYASKENGRNRITRWDQIESQPTGEA